MFPQDMQPLQCKGGPVGASFYLSHGMSPRSLLSFRGSIMVVSIYPLTEEHYHVSFFRGAYEAFQVECSSEVYDVAWFAYRRHLANSRYSKTGV